MSDTHDTPFGFGTTVSRATFTNRKEDLRRLKGNMAGGINTVLISPRRWGKSSLVEQATIELAKERKNVRVAVIDLFTCNSLEEFLENLSRATIAASSSKWEEQVRNAKTFFRNIAPRIEVGNDIDPGISIGFDWKEARKHIGDILDMPERIAKAKKMRLVVCIDEFQHLVDWRDDMRTQRLMRAHWQHHKHVTYVLYGSKRHMMTALFDHSGKPFYRFGDILWLQRISLDHWKTFIVDRFKSTGRSISTELAARIALTMKCHSYYTQQLAHFTWDKAGRKATEEDLRAGLELLLSVNTPLYQQQCEQMSTSQINLLKAVAAGEAMHTSADVMHDYRLGTPRNVQKARIALEARDAIEKTATGWSFLDPAFELWFRWQFMGVVPVLAAEG